MSPIRKGSLVASLQAEWCNGTVHTARTPLHLLPTDEECAGFTGHLYWVSGGGEHTEETPTCDDSPIASATGP